MPEIAMVLAAGLGTRMRPLTETLPKPLVQVNGKPLLDYALDAVAKAQVDTAVVNVHYLADQVVCHLEKRQSPAIVISDERGQLLNSGGGIKKALPLLGGKPFFLLNADTFWLEANGSNLLRLAASWNAESMDILLLLAPLDCAVGFEGKGDFFKDDAGRLNRRGEAETAPFAYAGAAILSPRIFDNEKETSFNLNRQFDQAIKAGRLFGLPLAGRWFHVGTVDAIIVAEDAMDTWKKAHWQKEK